MNITTAFLLASAISANLFCTPSHKKLSKSVSFGTVNKRYRNYKKKMEERFSWDPAQIVDWEDTLLAKPINPCKQILLQKATTCFLTKEDITLYVQKTGDNLFIHELFDIACREGNQRLILLLLDCGAQLHATQETIQELGRNKAHYAWVLVDDVPLWSIVRNGNPLAVQILLQWSTRPDQQLFSASLIKKLITFVEDRVNHYEKDDYKKIMALLFQYLALLDERHGKAIVVLPLEIEEHTPVSIIEQLSETEKIAAQPSNDPLTASEQQLLLELIPVHSFNEEGKPVEILTQKDRRLLYKAAVERELIVSRQLAEILTALVLNSYKSNAAWHLEFIVQKYPDVLIDGGYKLSNLIEILEKRTTKRR